MSNNRQVGRFRPLTALYTYAQDYLGAAYLAVWAVIIVEQLVITSMWGFNIGGVRGVNIPIGIICSLVILFIGFRPTNIAWSGGLGGLVALLMDRDKTQGVATGPVWLFKIVVALTYSFLLAAFVLMVVDFSAAPGAFWVLYVGAFVLLLTRLVIPATGTTRMLLQIIPLIFMFMAVWSVYGNTDSKTAEPRTQVQRAVVQSTATVKMPVLQSCDGYVGKLQSCKQVTIWAESAGGTPYQFNRTPDRCPVFSDAHLTTLEDLGDGSFQLHAKNKVVTFKFGYINPRETEFGYTCK